MEEERWDIYDRDGKPTGRTMARNAWPMAPGDYHASVICAIKNSAGEYLISQRAADKEWGAGWWEFPGGGVRAGETPEEACMREVREETGLSLLPSEISHALRYFREDPAQGNGSHPLHPFGCEAAGGRGSGAPFRYGCGDSGFREAGNLPPLRQHPVNL